MSVVAIPFGGSLAPPSLTEVRISAFLVSRNVDCGEIWCALDSESSFLLSRVSKKLQLHPRLNFKTSDFHQQETVRHLTLEEKN